MGVHPQDPRVTISEMDLMPGQEVGLVVEATDVAMLASEEEILGMGEVILATDAATLATHLTDQALDVKMDLLHSDPITIALVRPTLVRNALIKRHSISLAAKRSFKVANWRPRL